MTARMFAATLLVFAATSVATAQSQSQRGPRPSFPAEKFSTRPVQANPSSSAEPTEKIQKQRWDDRSRISPPRPK
jgi:hypothetical protein